MITRVVVVVVDVVVVVVVVIDLLLLLFLLLLFYFFCFSLPLSDRGCAPPEHQNCNFCSLSVLALI